MAAQKAIENKEAIAQDVPHAGAHAMRNLHGRQHAHPRTAFTTGGSSSQHRSEESESEQSFVPPHRLRRDYGEVGSGVGGSMWSGDDTSTDHRNKDDLEEDNANLLRDEEDDDEQASELARELMRERRQRQRQRRLMNDRVLSSLRLTASSEASTQGDTASAIRLNGSSQETLHLRFEERSSNSARARALHAEAAINRTQTKVLLQRESSLIDAEDNESITANENLHHLRKDVNSTIRSFTEREISKLILLSYERVSLEKSGKAGKTGQTSQTATANSKSTANTNAAANAAGTATTDTSADPSRSVSALKQRHKMTDPSQAIKTSQEDGNREPDRLKSSKSEASTFAVPDAQRIAQLKRELWTCKT